MIEYDDDNQIIAGKFEAGLRPASDVTGREWARYYRAKGIHDIKKLTALLPASAKKTLSEAEYRGFSSRCPPEFTWAELRHVPGAAPKLPTFTTPRKAPVRSFYGCHADMSAADYVREFCEANHLTT